MTQEEKARAYDEAIERAKSFQEKYGGDYAGYIFPELRESEDERIRKRLLAYIKGESKYLDTKKWIAYLEKQKEQKPAEWSEEDELMRTAVIQTLKMFDGRGTTDMQIDWLKSLRPSWKPSEEQLVTLLRAEGIIRVHDTKELAADLAQLYEQLKKLM